MEWKRERIRPLLYGLIYLGMTAFCFYDSLWGLIPALPFGYVVYRQRKAIELRKDRERIEGIFRELLIGIQTAVAAGYSLQNAFLIAVKELKENGMSHPVFDEELTRITNMLSVNEKLSKGFLHMSKRIGIGEIRDFALILEIVEWTGGNTVKIIRKTVDSISNRIETKRDTMVIIAAKKLEVSVMIIMPYLIIIYLRIANAGYLDSLYTSMTGRLVMSVGLIFIGIAWIIGDRIMEIKV